MLARRPYSLRNYENCPLKNNDFLNEHLLTFLKSGLSTDGEMESVRLVGPRAPATYRCLPSLRVQSAAADFANLADSKFILIKQTSFERVYSSGSQPFCYHAPPKRKAGVPTIKKYKISGTGLEISHVPHVGNRWSIACRRKTKVLYLNVQYLRHLT